MHDGFGSGRRKTDAGGVLHKPWTASGASNRTEEGHVVHERGDGRMATSAQPFFQLSLALSRGGKDAMNKKCFSRAQPPDQPPSFSTLPGNPGATLAFLL